MIPTKYAQLTFIFIVSIFMSCVVSSVSVLNTTGLVESFLSLWRIAWYKSWLVAFPSLLVITPLARLFVDTLIFKEDESPQVNQDVTLERGHLVVQETKFYFLRISPLTLMPAESTGRPKCTSPPQSN